MEKEEVAYCGLSCRECKRKFAEIRQKVAELDSLFDKVNMKAMAKAIPFMNAKYTGYKKLVGFFRNECPGCHKKGGNPFCGIRKCTTKKGYATCAECSTGLCKKFSMLFRIHTDNEIQTTIGKLKARQKQPN
jgi:hypothetical protein